MQPKKAPKTRRRYDADFKTEVLKMLDSGQTVTYVANAPGVAENLIYRWKSLNQVGKKVVAGQSELMVENQQLKSQVRQLETEREILKMPGRRSCRAFSAGPPEATVGAG